MQDQLARRYQVLCRLLVNLEALEPEERRQVFESAMQLLDGVPRRLEEGPPGVVINIVSTPAN
jgi:hypothetical protein